MYNFDTFRSLETKIEQIKDKNRIDQEKEIMKIHNLREVSLIVDNYKLSTIILKHVLSTPGLTNIKLILRAKTYLSECIRKIVRDLICMYFYKGIRILYFIKNIDVSVKYLLPLNTQTFNNAKIL